MSLAAVTALTTNRKKLWNAKYLIKWRTSANLGRMSDTRPCRIRSRMHAGDSPADAVGSAHAQLEPLAELKFIRQTMEQSASFSAISGWGLVAVGASALAAAAVAARFGDGPTPWLRIWIAEAILAAAIAGATSYRKAMRNGSPLSSGPARKVALGILPAVVCGAALTPLLYHAGLVQQIPAMWMLLYGAGMISGGMASTAPLPLMGAFFMAAGLAALGTGFASMNAAMAATFGGIHAAFGLIMIRRNDG